MRSRAGLLGTLWLAAVLHGCTASYVDTFEPKDAGFSVECVPQPGASGPGAALIVKIEFTGNERQYALGCNHRDAFLAHMQTIEDYWCDELEVPPRAFGDLLVATTTSEITRKRAATLDHGDGFTAFNCGEWLPELISKAKTARCCGN